MANQVATASIAASSSMSATALAKRGARAGISASSSMAGLATTTFAPTAPDTTTPGLPTPNPGLNTNSGLGPGPGLIYPSPSGALVRFDVVGWNVNQGVGAIANNLGNYGPVTVAQRLGAVNVSGIGDHTLKGLSVGGVQGALDVVFATGTAGGSPQHLAAIVDQIPTPTMYIAILLDTSNRPYAVVTNSSGSIVAQSTAAGPVIPAGISLEVTLTWSSLAPFVTFSIGDIPQAWTTTPSIPWTSFPPAWLMVGDGFGSNIAFTGTVGNVQVGNPT